MVSKAAHRSSNTKAVGSSLEKDKVTSLFYGQKSSQPNDLFYKQDDMSCLNYGRGYVIITLNNLTFS